MLTAYFSDVSCRICNCSGSSALYIAVIFIDIKVWLTHAVTVNACSFWYRCASQYYDICFVFLLFMTYYAQSQTFLLNKRLSLRQEMQFYYPLSQFVALMTPGILLRMRETYARLYFNLFHYVYFVHLYPIQQKVSSLQSSYPFPKALLPLPESVDDAYAMFKTKSLIVQYVYVALPWSFGSISSVANRSTARGM